MEWFRHLPTTLRIETFYWKGNSSNGSDLKEFIETELNRSRSEIHQRCIQGGLWVTKETVVTIIKELGPEWVYLGGRKNLQQLYFPRGPNWVGHIDGYDKLKTHGFNIHGAIDGFSCCILWLKVIRSSKNQSFVCTQYSDCVKFIEGVFREVAGDHGTKNVFVFAAQIFLTRFHVEQF